MTEHLIASPRPAVRVGATAAAGAATVTLVSIVVNRVDGRPGPHNMALWLSDAASGAGATAVTASGVVVAGASGFIVDTPIAKKWMRVQTDATGLFILSITDAAKTPFVVCVEIEGRTFPVLTLATANYG
jgi:hypothetical protein